MVSASLRRDRLPERLERAAQLDAAAGRAEQPVLVDHGELLVDEPALQLALADHPVAD